MNQTLLRFDDADILDFYRREGFVRSFPDDARPDAQVSWEKGWGHNSGYGYLGLRFMPHDFGWDAILENGQTEPGTNRRHMIGIGSVRTAVEAEMVYRFLSSLSWQHDDKSYQRNIEAAKRRKAERESREITPRETPAAGLPGAPSGNGGEPPAAGVVTPPWDPARCADPNCLTCSGSVAASGAVVPPPMQWKPETQTQCECSPPGPALLLSEVAAKDCGMCGGTGYRGTTSVDLARGLDTLFRRTENLSKLLSELEARVLAVAHADSNIEKELRAELKRLQDRHFETATALGLLVNHLGLKFVPTVDEQPATRRIPAHFVREPRSVAPRRKRRKAGRR